MWANGCLKSLAQIIQTFRVQFVSRQLNFLLSGDRVMLTGLTRCLGGQKMKKYGVSDRFALEWNMFHTLWHTLRSI
jgi:hypothetical protein